MNRKSNNNKIPEMKDENGEVIDGTLIPDAFNKYFVELGGKLVSKSPRLSILPDSFLSDVHHPVNGLASFQEIFENDVLKLLHGLTPSHHSLSHHITTQFFLIKYLGEYLPPF
jgi:hypothetical protein